MGSSTDKYQKLNIHEISAKFSISITQYNTIQVPQKINYCKI